MSQIIGFDKSCFRVALREWFVSAQYFLSSCCGPSYRAGDALKVSSSSFSLDVGRSHISSFAGFCCLSSSSLPTTTTTTKIIILFLIRGSEGDPQLARVNPSPPFDPRSLTSRTTQDGRESRNSFAQRRRPSLEKMIRESKCLPNSRPQILCIWFWANSSV